MAPDCLRIIVRAETRMANELDAAQNRGEVATQGERANTRSSGISDYNGLGIDFRRLAEWRPVTPAPTGASRLRCRGHRRQASLGRTTASACASVSTAAEAEALTLRPVAAICWDGCSQSIGWNVSPSAARTASTMWRHTAPGTRIRLQIGHCIGEPTSFQKVDGLAPEQGPYQFPHRRPDCGPNRLSPKPWRRYPTGAGEAFAVSTIPSLR